MPEGKILLVEAVVGSSSADDGSLLFLGFKMPDGTTFNLAVPHTAAIDLMALNAGAVGEAACRRSGDPARYYAFPLERYQIELPDPDGSFRIHLIVPGSLDLSFQFDRPSELLFYEALGAALGVNIPTPLPGTWAN